MSKIPLYIANTFLQRGFEENVDISPMKLQKLIYIFYKENLQSSNQKLFDEKFQVWKYGPVLSSVYEIFKIYGAKPITDYYMDDDNTFTTIDFSRNNDLYKIFDKIWTVYKNFNGIYLSMLTHLCGTAWYKAKERKEYYLSDFDISEEFDYEQEIQ